jgi:hypothetical protein
VSFDIGLDLLLQKSRITRLTAPKDIAILYAGTQQGNSYGFGGGFYGFVLWKMKFLNISLIFAGFILLGRCLPTKYCMIYYGFKRMKEEQGLLIQQ